MVKPIASLIMEGKLKQTQARSFPLITIKVKRISKFEKILKVLVWILRPESVERASVLHQPDGVGSERSTIIPFGEFNAIPITLVAMSGVVSKSAVHDDGKIQ